MELKDKIAVVTGASGGIGGSVALALARAGAAVVLNYSANREKAEALQDTITAGGGRALAVKADVSDYEQCENMVRRSIDHFKRIDILVNNAGITRDNLIVRMSPEQWREVIETNLTGVYNCCRAVLKPLLRQKSGGRIVNIASVSGLHGNSGQANYSAAKGGVIALTRTLAKELGSRDITVNAVAPGFIETEMTANLPERARDEALARIALGRFGRPEEVAEVVLFLAASAAYVTGQVIAVDGSLAL